MKSRFTDFIRDEQGQDLIEFTILLTFVMFAVVGLAMGYHGSIAGIVNTTDSNLAAANAAVH